MPLIDAAALKRIAPGGLPRIRDGFAEAVNDYAERFGVAASLTELAHFIAQNAHESAGFRTVVEYASGKAYEGRRDLGNVQPGDGVRFKGRGAIQCTGRANHRAFTRWARRHFEDAPDFERNPEALEVAPWCFLVSLWYWTERKIGRLVKGEAEDIIRITKAINGGLNGLADRKAFFAKAVAELGRDPQIARQTKTILAQGDRGAAVRKLQARLRELGYLPGPADGVFGPKTAAALREFQARTLRLVTDGVAGPQTWAALDADDAPPAGA